MTPIIISQQTARRFILGKQGLWPGRRWGDCVLPVLYGDNLVARLDSKLDQATMTLEIKSFWHEDVALVKDGALQTRWQRD